jgi:uncharacterized phiE125 gp8 family phage protein
MRATRVLITAPTATVLSVAECKTMLGISTSDQDSQIDAAIAAAVSSLDPSFGGWLDRALRPQTWELRLSEFPYCDEEIRLPFPVHTSVTSIKYDDAAGTEQTLVANTDYIVVGLNGHLSASVLPAYGKSWPSARCIADSVRIRYVCGYAPETDDTPSVADKFPQALKYGIAMMVRATISSSSQNLFVSSDKVDGIGEKRYVVSSEGLKVMQQAAESMLYNFKPL